MEHELRRTDGHPLNADPRALPAYVQVQIRRLYLEGKSYRAIQAIVGVSSRTVAKYTACLPESRKRGSPIAS